MDSTLFALAIVVLGSLGYLAWFFRLIASARRE